VDGLKLAFKKHHQWLGIVQSFGCNLWTAEDIVGEMYIKLDRVIKQGKDITRDGDINHFYVFKVLTSIFLDLKRKEAKYILVELEDYNDPHNEIEVQYLKNYERILETLQGLYWYDQKVFEIIESGESISELSRKTNISYYSLYNTYKKVKRILKEII
jgi:DNA-directed RNA polymerase specialized sigma24 family protein